MRKILLALIVSSSLVFTCFAQDYGEIARFEPADRILILAPHPDDEAIACAGIIQKALKSGARVKIAYLTNGDHNEVAFIVYEKRITFRKREFLHMGEVRRKEAIKAMGLLGVPGKDLIFLGYPDFGTYAIFSKYWDVKKPFRNLLTRVSKVPYKEDLSFGAPYVGQSILADLKKILLEFKPNKIFVSHPADVNVDHKTFYLFTQIALADLKGSIPKPEIYHYLVHCVGWPLPRHYRPQLGLDPPEKFLNSQAKWAKSALSPEEVGKKHEAILSYRSQTASSAFYLLAFCRTNELFGNYETVLLEGQHSLKEKAVSFFGFSRMYPGADIEDSTDAKSLLEDRGQVSYAVVDSSLYVKVQKPENMKQRFGVSLSLFGYSSKMPFAMMPKIQINTISDRFRVFDGRKLLCPSGVTLELSARALILRVPLSTLGGPEFILTSIRSYGGKVPADFTAFRKLEIK